MKTLFRTMIRIFMRFAPVRGGIRFFTRVGLLPQSLWIRLPVEGDFGLKIEGGGEFRYRSSYQDGIGRGLYWKGAGGFEPETMKWFGEQVDKAQIFADIGANTGHFSLYACGKNPDIQAYAFEPVPATFQRLHDNAQLNGWEQRLHVFPKAAGIENTRTSFHVPFDEFPTSASFNPDGHNNLPGTLIEVDVIRLDEMFRDQPAPDLLKIDVEGFEHTVLEGMHGLFDAGHRPTIIFECHFDGPADEITAILKPYGYQFFHLCDDGLKPYDKVAPQQCTAFKNWVAMPK